MKAFCTAMTCCNGEIKANTNKNNGKMNIKYENNKTN